MKIFNIVSLMTCMLLNAPLFADEAEANITFEHATENKSVMHQNSLGTKLSFPQLKEKLQKINDDLYNVSYLARDDNSQIIALLKEQREKLIALLVELDPPSRSAYEENNTPFMNWTTLDAESAAKGFCLVVLMAGSIFLIEEFIRAQIIK